MRAIIEEIKRFYNFFDACIVLSRLLCYNNKNGFYEVTYGGEL